MSTLLDQTQTPQHSAPSDRQVQVTLDHLLSRQRALRPSDGFWRLDFEPGLTRKLMKAVSRPRAASRTLTVVGWVTPLVFAAIVAAALGVAYFFSPGRAMARWEAGTHSRQYVVDSLPSASSGRPYQVDAGLSGYSFSATPTVNSASAYQFTPGAGAGGQF